VKIAEIVVCAVLVTGAVTFFVVRPTRHLTQTPSRKVHLTNGVNVIRFPAIQGRYLLRIGGPDMKPAAFTFHVNGRIETPDGSVSIAETYVPQPDVLSKQRSGGYVSTLLEISKPGDIGVEIVASFPEAERPRMHIPRHQVGERPRLLPHLQWPGCIKAVIMTGNIC
jgi:hypothetical protein